jgi:hypothetical protein
MIYITTTDWHNYTTANSIKPAWTKYTQVSTCPGLMNYVGEGMVILSPKDYEFETKNGWLIPWNVATETDLTLHVWEQADIHKDNSTIVKIQTGVMGKQDEPERIFCLLGDYEPLDPAIKVIPAIFPLLDFWSPFLINTVWPNGHHKIKRGDPIVRVFISHYGEFNFKHIDDKEHKLPTQWLNLKNSSRSILTAFNDAMNKCPIHKKN